MAGTRKARRKAWMDPRSLKKRLCLRCDKLFPSYGPHHRICPSCTSHPLEGADVPSYTIELGSRYHGPDE